MKPSGAGVEFLTGEQEIVRYLLEDVGRLPIISNRAQELWLGIPLKAFTRLKELRTARPAGDLSLRVTEAFGRSCATLLESASGTPWASEIAIPDWSRELLVARANIYGLQRSRLRRLLDRLGKESPQPPVEQILQQTFEVVELLALLPNEPLKLLAKTSFPTSFESAELLALFPPEWGDKEYAAWAKGKARDARQHLVTGYLRYALRIARNYAGNGLEFPDLAQNAFMGLMRAAELHDYRINARFGTYATNWIWQRVTRALAEGSSLIRIPVHRRDMLNKLTQIVEAEDDGTADPLAAPAVLRAAGFLAEQQEEADGMQGSGVRLARRRAARLILLGYPVELSVRVHWPEAADDDAGESLEECLPAAPVADLYASRQIIATMLGGLTERERNVLTMRFGLADGQDHTLEEIGRAFGLSRERIRQIQAHALGTLQRRFSRRFPALTKEDLYGLPAVWNITAPRVAGGRPIDLMWEREFAREGPPDWLDQSLFDLPRSSWHASSASGSGVSGVRSSGPRVAQLIEALVSLGAPAHYARIVETVNEGLPSQHALDGRDGYRMLVGSERTFLLLGEGVFSLVEWEEARGREPEPQLPYCPMALPDPPAFEGALFESIFVGREYLHQEPDAADFLAHMLPWAEADPSMKPWLRQGVLSAYYLLGLIPYTFIYSGGNPRLRSTLPDGDIQTLRRYCLQTLTERLAAMPEFWWLLRGAGTARPVDVGEQLAEIHPHDLDDARQRLYLLHSLGAAVRLPYGAYRLTPLGEACAAEWGRSPDDEADAILELAADFEPDLMDWGFL